MALVNTGSSPRKTCGEFVIVKVSLKIHRKPAMYNYVWVDTVLTLQGRSAPSLTSRSASHGCTYRSDMPAWLLAHRQLSRRYSINPRLQLRLLLPAPRWSHIRRPTRISDGPLLWCRMHERRPSNHCRTIRAGAFSSSELEWKLPTVVLVFRIPTCSGLWTCLRVGGRNWQE